jgi:hypothetical protein
MIMIMITSSQPLSGAGVRKHWSAEYGIYCKYCTCKILQRKSKQHRNWITNVFHDWSCHLCSTILFYICQQQIGLFLTVWYYFHVLRVFDDYCSYHLLRKVIYYELY